MTQIIDPKTGQPFSVKKSELTHRQTEASVYSVRPPTPGYSMASNITPERCARALREAESFFIEPFIVLAEEIEERDMHYSSVLRTRKLKAASLPMTITPGGESEKDLMLAEEIRKLMNRPFIKMLKMDLLDGLGKGFSVCELMYRTSKTKWEIISAPWVDARFFEFDQETRQELLLKDKQNPNGGTKLSPGKYVVHKPRIKSGLPIRNGLARLQVVMFMLKSFSIRDWWAFSEIYGMPVRLGKYHPNATQKQIDTLVDAVRNLASDAGAVVPEGMDIDIKEAKRGESGQVMFESMARWCDEQTSKAVLGQTMTTENGSSYSQANIHNEVRLDIANWDGMQLASTFNEQVIQPYIEMNYGIQAAYPMVSFEEEDAEDTEKWVKNVGEMVDRGLKVCTSDVYDRLKLKIPDDKTQSVLLPKDLVSGIQGVSVSESTADLATNRQVGHIAMNRKETESDALPDSDEWERIIDPIAEPILEAAKQANSYAELVSMLTEIKANSNDEHLQGLIESLTSATSLARMAGEVGNG